MTLKLFACGDIVNKQNKRDFISSDLKNIITNCDLSVCNFEAAIASSDLIPINKAGPHLYQSKESTRYVRDAGFNFASLANNHIYDYGETAFVETLEEFRKFDIEVIGAANNFRDVYTAQIVERENIKIAFFAACENEFGCLYEEQDRGGYAWLFHPLLEDNIREIKSKVDVIILIAHAGVEDIAFPIKEWRGRYKRLCDLGVDVIIGHHPHVPQGYEKHNDSMIFYSLGNFYFDTAGFDQSGDDSYSVILELDKNGFVDFETIYHKKILGQTCLVEEEDVTFSLTELNSLLKNNYDKRNDEKCIELFYDYYLSYYEDAVGVQFENTSLFKLSKQLIKRIFFGSKNEHNRNLLLLHNIRNESHRFVVQRALRLLSEIDKN